MGNNNQSPTKRSSSELSNTQTMHYPRKQSKPHRANQFLQQNLQITRSQMIDAWINLIVKSLKKKGNQQKNWKQTCFKMSQAIKEFTRSSYWKVFQVIELWSSKQIIEMKSQEFKKESKEILSLRKARCTIIDIKSMNKRISRRTKQRKLESPETSEINNNKEIKENIALILENEFRQSYHPFSEIKRIFIEDIESIYKYIPYSEEADQDEEIIETLSKDFKAIVLFILKCCQIYKEWVQNFTNLKEKGYTRFMSKIIINFLFDSPSTLHTLLIKILKKSNSAYIESISTQLRQSISIKKFNIRQQLEIQGNYIKSMMMISDINTITHPKELLKFFETLKSQIETDIQFFNKTFDKKEETVIDGDNLLSIMCYMLCKMKVKLPDVHAQLLFLHVVYGQTILTEYDSASYIVTAMMAAIDYLKSEDFLDIVQG